MSLALRHQPGYEARDAMDDTEEVHFEDPAPILEAGLELRC